VVLSSATAGNLVGALNTVGVLTGPVVVNPLPRLPILPITAAPQTTKIAELETDWKTLVTELQSLAAKSGVTIADVESVVSDGQAIGQAGYHFNAQSLKTVISELANAVASGASTGQSETDFNNLFTGSSVSTTLLTSTFNDLVKIITDSSATTTDLSTVASDEAAVQSDLTAIRSGWETQWQGWIASLGGQSVTPGSSSIVSPSVSGINPIIIDPFQPPIAPVPPFGPVVPAPPFIINPIPGYSLLASLNYTGVVTRPVIASPSPTTSTNPKFQQLGKDIQALQTELQSLAAKSGVTVSELESLSQDGLAIAQAGFHFNPQSLNKVMSELANAVAGGTSTSQSLTDFTALFANSSISTTLITGSFNDLVKAIGSSNVTTSDLSTVASDEAAIQADLKSLRSASGSGKSGSGSGLISGGSTGSTGSSGSTGSAGSTGSTGNTGSGKHHHLPLRKAKGHTHLTTSRHPKPTIERKRKH
jgi:hypothetical protein